MKKSWDDFIKISFGINKKILKPFFWKKRLTIIKFSILLLFGILLLRLFYLQIIKHSYYCKKAKERSVVKYIIRAPRGQIITSDGVIVATNRAVFQLYVDPKIIKDHEEEILYKLSKILNENFGELKEKYYFAKRKFLGRILIKRNLTWDQVAKILVRLYYLPGVSIEVESERYYPYGEIYFHLIGYVSRIRKEEYLKRKNKGYDIEDYIGRRGVERAFEEVLKGKNGIIEIEKDAFGRLGKVIKRIEPIPGNDLVLTVNHKLQLKAFELIKNKKGSIIAISPKDGGILALVSSPAVNPQKFVEGFSQREWSKVTKDPTRPLTNRALSAYSPGSTYKVITALAGLKYGIIKNPNQGLYCPGYFIFKNRRFRCWKKHQKVGLIKAISESCDTYFYWVASQLDVDVLAEISKEFGLGELSGLDWPEEKRGLVPTKKWKKHKLKKPWYPGETLILAIGQGYLQVTPLQMAQVYASIINGGYLYKPYIVKEIRYINGKIKKIEPLLKRKIKIEKKYLDFINKGLLETVKSGTGKQAFISGLVIGGKTGTAQVVSSERKIKRLKPHAWFVSYAGIKEPEIVTTIFIENGGHGGSVAAPLAKDLYKVYFADYLNKLNFDQSKS